MLYRDIESQEGYIHICDDAHKYKKEYIKNRPQIILHDVSCSMLAGKERTRIKFCPYCGANIEKEQQNNITNEFYKF